jgi:hypothetical protein
MHVSIPYDAPITHDKVAGIIFSLGNLEPGMSFAIGDELLLGDIQI